MPTARRKDVSFIFDDGVVRAEYYSYVQYMYVVHDTRAYQGDNKNS
jgi:hypothetical protein